MTARPDTPNWGRTVFGLVCLALAVALLLDVPTVTVPILGGVLLTFALTSRGRPRTTPQSRWPPPRRDVPRYRDPRPDRLDAAAGSAAALRAPAASPAAPALASPTSRPRPSIPTGLRFSVLARDGFRCRYCGRGTDDPSVQLHIDHVLPVAQGGATVPTNLVTACASCNLGKASRVIDFAAGGLALAASAPSLSVAPSLRCPQCREEPATLWVPRTIR